MTMTNEGEATEAKTFAEGDLGRVQGLLFGDQFDAINTRIDSLESVLLESVEAVRNEMRDELDRTLTKIEKTKTQVDKRIDTKIAKEATSRKDGIRDLSALSNTDTAQLKSDLAATAATFEKSLGALKRATEKAVESSRASLEQQLRTTDEKLSSSKVDRTTLAQLLTSTAEQISTEEERASSQNDAPKSIHRAA